MEQKQTRTKGFTLIELSIVVVIIGLIVAGVVAGQSLVTQAKLRSLITDTDKFNIAIKTFKLTYNMYPGDIPNAVAYWGGTTANGNGNGVIEGANGASSPTEDLLAWQHLAMAELIPGAYTGQLFNGGDRYEEGVNAPKSPFSNSGYEFADWPTLYTRVTGGRTIIVGQDWDFSINRMMQAFLTPSQASSIDTKADDGSPGTGKWMTMRGEDIPDSSSLCVDVEWWAGNPSYTFAQDNVYCILFYYYR